MSSAGTHSQIPGGVPAYNSGSSAAPYLHRISSGGTASAHLQVSSNGCGLGDPGAAFPRGSDATAAAGTVPGAFASAGHGWTMGAVPQPQAPAGAAGGGSRRGRKPKPRLPDLQSQLEALSQQFERLSSENVFLKSKLKALEKVVPNRQVNLDFLASVKSNSQQQQSQQQVAQSAASAAPGQVEAQLARSGSSGVGPAAVADAAPVGVSWQSSAATALSSGASASAVATELAPALLNRGGIGGGSGAGLPSPASAAALAEAAAAGTSGRGAVGSEASQKLLILELCPEPDGEVPDMPPAAIEELKRTGVKEFLALWKHVAFKTSLLVAAAEAMGPGSAHAARLERYVGRMMDYLDRIVLLSPDVWFLCQYINAETLEEERPSDDFWMAIGKYANFSREQLEEIESLAKAHEETVAPVVQERARLASELSNHISAMTSGPAVVESTHGISALNAVDALTEQLQRNVLKEQQTHNDATDFLCWSVVTPVQVARIMAAAYPYVPDGVALMHACRQLHRQAQEQQQQQQRAAALQSQQQHSQ
ncbi:hypothetical protein HYH02_013609 [Chlamydomonas schloesseri]|uniref:Uncharacterized protein n=1 Tax=Chlamydomonas schloesseri TaxID=2026947 RepID=A0A835T1K7_9CHLO|nr:hypothetical protein HYH02_013609 [Chlamydomonas schloesseri]|eukprot:KAG2430770.1 hypothetical protein HYH02_013609 [Chlamydomonas schloesseri]